MPRAIKNVGTAPLAIFNKVSDTEVGSFVAYLNASSVYTIYSNACLGYETEYVTDTTQLLYETGSDYIDNPKNSLSLHGITTKYGSTTYSIGTTTSGAIFGFSPNRTDKVSVKLDKTAPAPTKSFTIDKSTLNNCSTNPSILTYTQGSSGTIEITPNSGYHWGTALPYLSDGFTTIATATLDESTGKASITFTNIQQNLYLYGTPEKDTITITIQDGTLTNCTCTHTPEGSPLPSGTEVTFTFTPNDGYEFGGDEPYIQFDSPLGGYSQQYATISENKSTATVTRTLIDSDKTIGCYGVATLKPEVPTTSYDFINVYNCTKDNIKSLAKYRFVVPDESNPYNIVDLGYYVTSLKKFYCDIPTSITSNIALATIDTKISAKLVAQDDFTIDCGNVTIESTNDNVNDYNNTNCEIYLPFIGIVSIDSTRIIGRSLHLSYKVSTLSGDCKAILTDTETNYTMYEWDGNVSDTIPYILNNIDWQLQGELPTSQLIESFIPYIMIVYHNNYNSDKTILLNDNKYTLLSDLTGLNCITNVIINDTSIPDDEKDYITNTLESGVIF